MKKDFLLEILVQELPYKFIDSAMTQLKSSFEKLFSENALSFGEIKTYGTPRRLAVLVNDLDVCQNTLSKDIKGPILKIAKDEKGDYTSAAVGFAKKNNVELSQLYEKDDYIWAKVEIKGQNTVDILKNNIESLILKLQGAHFMRWGYNSEKFSRPIEGIVALFGSDIVDLKVLDKVATNKTQGHRYSQNRYITIDEPKNYLEILKSANVIADPKERKAKIVELATICANENSLKIKFDDMEELLEEVTYITEWPVAILCEFDKKYLQIPSIVTTTVMSTHQRYFPLWQNDNQLSNKFITMANYVNDDFSNIKAGNQRVICARLEDGVFFYQEDTKTKLIDKFDKLSGMTFQKGLGTLLDKTNRIMKLSSYLSEMLGVSDNQDILRCAKLCKCDLSTKLVFEFTELQGFIGENYALIDGEKENVAKGICEHYFPLAANAPLPNDIVGQIVSIADKIDTICALFISTQDNKKKRPTGSNDPLALRRAAIGVMRIILEKNLKIDLSKLISYSLELFSKEFSFSVNDELLADLNDFFNQRLLFMFEKEFDSNVINSIISSNPLENLSQFIKKAKILTDYRQNGEFNLLKENANRTKRILKDEINQAPDSSLFVLDEEKALYEAINGDFAAPGNIEDYIKSLYTLIKPTSDFFDKVLVMDKDEKIKNNRLSLLSKLNEKFSAICDFEKL